MKNKFTEGNWKIKQDTSFPTLHQIWNDVNSEDAPTYIARTCYAPKSEANAKLIASAPEMLDQLIESNKAFEALLSVFGSKMAITTKYGISMQIKENELIIEKATK